LEHASLQDHSALVVDDDAFMLAALAELLSEDGYDVHTASNGFSALRLANELHPAVIVLDLVLPERSGMDVLRDLRGDAATRDMGIVIVTGHVDALTPAMVAETDAVVAKPFDEDELLLAVHRALLRAVARRDEVAPVAATVHRDALARARRAAGAHRSRGRR
jgi:DNA-binding response OmpR family regulator